MKIYSMSATFGKLEAQTLTLEPGLNILQAPNEWGKSTWCAFLVAMLYGLETRAKSTKTTLADKERFAPWSGSPMEGRIDLCWQGRDITIERKTLRRIPLGDFRAYETATGLPVPELDGSNCGFRLLGVERSVFLRSGFIRFSELPVTGDEALRRRLNALVTTGDENATGDRLAGALKELKNRCRYHKTGLLPQAEAQRAELQARLRAMEDDSAQVESLGLRLEQVQQRLTALSNHQNALLYQAAQADACQVAQGEEALALARQSLAQAEAACRDLPGQEQVQRHAHRLELLERQRLDLQMEQGMAPPAPEPPAPAAPFGGLSGEEALARAREDAQSYEYLRRARPLAWILPVCLMIAGGALSLWRLLPGLALTAAGVLALGLGLLLGAGRRRRAREIAGAYPRPEPDTWLSLAQDYLQDCRSHDAALEAWHSARQTLQACSDRLEAQIRQATNGRSLDQALLGCRDILQQWETLANAGRQVRRAEQYAATLRAMAKSAQPPAFPDALTYSREETERLLSDCRLEQHKLQNLLGQAQGRLQAQGSRQTMEQELAEVQARIARLEQTYGALTLAQETLAQASAQLQRRFAPRIASGAQALMASFTQGRYQRILLGEDFTLQAGTQGETLLREARWRSDGTLDQLYLALRLAVAQELLPQAPLILDDALVRFDDTRAKAALETLKELGRERQILLFTCHSREAQLKNSGS